MIKLSKNWEQCSDQDIMDGVLILWHGPLVDHVVVTGGRLSILGVINCIVEHPLTEFVAVYSIKTGSQVMDTSIEIVEEQ